MTDDELIERLNRSLKTHASTVSSPPDAWDDFVQQAGHTLPLGRDRRRPAWWLPTAVVATAVAVAAAALFVVLRSPPARSSKVQFATPPTAATVPPITSPPPATSPAIVAPPVSVTTVVPPAGPAGGPVPKGFSPVSVTFVSLRTGWVLGTAPCPSPPCTSMLRTNDGGKTWVGIPAPRAPLSPGLGGSGVSHVRFANLSDGWVFGPDLWATHDGGAHWHQVIMKGVPAGSSVMALEAASGLVHAAVIGNQSLWMFTSAPDHDAWAASSTALSLGAGPVPDARIVLQGRAGWMIEVNRTVVGGARLEQGRWVTWQPPCMSAGGPATLAASSAIAMVAVCDEGVWTGPVIIDRVYASSDAGTTFHQVATPTPFSGSQGSWSVTSPLPQTIVVGAYTGAGSPVLRASFDGGTTWRTVAGYQQSWSWADLGFTSPTQGVAVLSTTVGGPSATLLMTTDGGHTWYPVAFRQAHA
jgi:photosystem II stability/assembly factor-like uncharacterized protein